MQQVLEYQESTRLQYGLGRRAVAWGWPEARALVIDDNLGRSDTSAEVRQGFQRLAAEVGLNMRVATSRIHRSAFFLQGFSCAIPSRELLICRF
jgi:hypothetical protein